jgi:hypothetical protein
VICSAESHDAVKSDLAAFRALTFVGAQTIDFGPDEGLESYEVRNCTCHSTLYRRCSQQEAVELMAKHAHERTLQALAILRREELL